MSDRQDVSFARAAFARWRAQVGNIQLLNSASLEYNRLRLQRQAWKNWTARQDGIRRLDQAARVADSVFKLRSAFNRWQGQLQTKKQAAWIKDKQKRDVKAAFTFWLQSTRQQKLLRKKCKTLVRAKRKRTERKVLDYWFARVVVLKERALFTSINRDKVVLHEAFAKWTRATRKQGELVSLMQSFRDVRDHDLVQQILRGWNQAAKLAHSRREAFAIVQARHQQGILARAWGQWRYQSRTMVLEPLADEFVIRVDDGLAYAALTMWKAKSTRLPAIEFNNRILRKEAWAKWRRMLPEAKKLKAAAEMEDRKLACESSQLLSCGMDIEKL